jgi:hypothetical protein
MPRCTYATLTGAARTESFKKFLKKKGFGVPRKRDKNGKRIIGKNHVSQIMKRRAAAERANKAAKEEVWRQAAQRRIDAERAEKFNRHFFGITEQMTREQEEIKRIEVLRKMNAKRIKNMPYKVWLRQYLGDEAIALHYDLRANRIRLAWKLYMRRKSKRPRIRFVCRRKKKRVTWNDIPEIVEFLNGRTEYFNVVKIIK